MGNTLVFQILSHGFEFQSRPKEGKLIFTDDLTTLIPPLPHSQAWSSGDSSLFKIHYVG